MSFVVTTLRRSLWLLLIGAVGGGVWSWWSDRNTPPSPPTPPEWPPLDAETATKPSPTLSTADTGGWVAPDADGACPITHPIKANGNSKIFHVPTGRFYERTNPERCYPTPEAAVTDGYRQAKA